jgi:mannose-6-phosphate isomerase-like protein (cupin superfamily)
MKGYIVNIEEETLKNNSYRRVLYTARNSQLVLMSLLPGEDVGEETHELDQFIRFEQGKVSVLLNGAMHIVSGDYAVVIPAGVKHNITNVGDVPVKLYTVYSPPEHKDGIEQKTKDDEREEHFDGVTTE